jgi:glycosyltransferase involved in cell wall biosynthesis
MPSTLDSHQPLISVIIPTYNRLSYLKEAIASVVQQTYSNIEIIVSDDCSPENPQSLIDSFQDPRIRLRRNSTNLGIGQNATHALKEAQGELIASLNDDDLWEPCFLEKLAAPLLNDPSLALAFCDYYVINPDGQIDFQHTQTHAQRENRHQLASGVHQPFWKIGLVDKAVFAASAALVRKDAVAWEKVHEAGVFWDYYIVYLACRSGRGAYYCSEKLAKYRVHPLSENMISGSRSAQAKVRKGKAEIFCCERFINDPQLHELHAYFWKVWAHANTTLGIGLLRSQQIAEARPYLFRALQRQKFDIRTLIALGLSFVPQTVAKPFINTRNIFSKYAR